MTKTPPISLNSPEQEIPSPCIRQCMLNEHDICQGCFRTIDEICQWSKANNLLKKRIIAAAQARQAQQ